MKKMLFIFAILFSIAACAPKAPLPSHCELFGVQLGMPKHEAIAVITEKFGRIENSDGGGLYELENIYSDGVKYESVQFWFSEKDVLASITAYLYDIEDLYPHPDTEMKVIKMLYDELYRVDSSLVLKHKVYSFPQTSNSYLDGNFISTIAAKDIFNTEDFITVNVKKYDYKENSYGVSISLSPFEKFKYSNAFDK